MKRLSNLGSRKKQILRSRILWGILLFEILIVLFSIFYFYIFFNKPKAPSSVTVTKKEITKPKEVKTGKILKEDPVKVFSKVEAKKIILQNNLRFDSEVNEDISKQNYTFSTSDGLSDKIPVSSRVYFPNNKSKKPAIVLGPGATGLDDSCSASLENPNKANWGNYESIAMSYVSKGYIVIVVDYEGMQDQQRLHHFMVGELTGKSMLDGARSLKNLTSTKDIIDSSKIFVAGFSEGGHAAYWADEIKDQYAPELSLLGAIGFSPVTSAEETIDDSINGSDTNWFAPLLITSYSDWYKTPYPVEKIFNQKYSKSLQADSKKYCLDSFNKIWPSNLNENRSAEVYTQEFGAVAKSLNISSNPAYKNFASDLLNNIVGNVKTDRPKLINHAVRDKVILLSQSQHGFERMCIKGNSVSFNKYDNSPLVISNTNPSAQVDHSNIMTASFKDTLLWMQNIIESKPITNNCK